MQVINPLADINAGADTVAATSFAARLDQELALNGSVEDDGLPRGSQVTISWKKNSGPGTVYPFLMRIRQRHARVSAQRAFMNLNFRPLIPNIPAA